jgi:flagellar basal body rod protein FlgG
MTHGIYTATAGAIARQAQVDVVANNIANAGSTGFQSMDVSFEEVLTRATTPERHFAVVRETRLSPERGSLKQTGNPLDLALLGTGFFAAQTPEGHLALIRSTSVRVTSSGLLQDPEGRTLLSGGKPLSIDPTLPVSITPEGEVMQEDQTLGRLTVLSVPDPTALKPLGHRAYQPTEASGPPFEVGAEVVSGSLESSNVEPVKNMVQLVQLERDFQSLLRAVEAYKEADEQLIGTASGRY